jgi:glycosyltransferase involved in cell wall biosynthesis
LTDRTLNWCVLVPCFNEALAIRDVLTPLLDMGMPVIVVDDGSDDGTAELVEPLPVTLIRRRQRGGKGEALRSGFEAALAAGYEAVVTMDGDGQHAAADVPRLVAAARRYPGHMVIGARLRQRARQPGYRRLANQFADWGVSWACGRAVVDSQCGQRLYPHAALQLGASAAGGFVFEADVLIAASRQGMGVVAVPIESRYGPDLRGSHFRPLRDFVHITRRVVGHVVSHGRIREQYRRARAAAPLVFDPPTDQLP